MIISGLLLIFLSSISCSPVTNRTPTSLFMVHQGTNIIMQCRGLQQIINDAKWIKSVNSSRNYEVLYERGAITEKYRLRNISLINSIAGRFDLIINDVRVTDSGIYKCISGSLPTVTYKIYNLTVLPIHDERRIFQCSLPADEPYNRSAMVWTKQQRTIDDTSYIIYINNRFERQYRQRMQIDQSGERQFNLILNYILPSDKGTVFNCILLNKLDQIIFIERYSLDNLGNVIKIHIN